MSNVVAGLTGSRIFESARAWSVVAPRLFVAAAVLALVACSGDERERLPPTIDTRPGALVVSIRECCREGEHRTEMHSVEEALVHTEESAGFPLVVPATLPDPSLRLTYVTIDKPRFGETTSEVNLVYTVPGEGVPPRTRLSIVQLGPDYSNNLPPRSADSEMVEVGSSRVRVDPLAPGDYFYMVVDGKLQVWSTGIPRDAVLSMIEDLLTGESRLS